MKKKSVLIETAKQGKSWSIKVTSTDTSLHADLINCIRHGSQAYGLSILNGADPLADTISKRKRKIHKPVMGQPDEETMQHLHERLTRELKS